MRQGRLKMHWEEARSRLFDSGRGVDGGRKGT
jgi:hypothetical protein